MEKVEKYRDCIKKILSEYAAYKPSYGDVEVQIIFDMERDRYQVIRVGWDNKQRVYGCSMHLDIKDGKIWIQQNATEIDIGQELVNLGVPSSDIVVGFHPPYMRQFTEFAVS
ncbi:MAG TPA: XisI protein [Cyanobacteria bacterium UBA11369]|nr:XisI protein [Cyanobacteria bacterium UBA11371]HBE31309.1 XisI protein [Cyanobacteria bacterium UBA11368]HBE53314.1 XisI protein [Cyanobacteria bacterium UBA11369]